MVNYFKFHTFLLPVELVASIRDSLLTSTIANKKLYAYVAVTAIGRYCKGRTEVTDLLARLTVDCVYTANYCGL